MPRTGQSLRGGVGQVQFALMMLMPGHLDEMGARIAVIGGMTSDRSSSVSGHELMLPRNRRPPLPRSGPSQEMHPLATCGPRGSRYVRSILAESVRLSLACLDRSTTASATSSTCSCRPSSPAPWTCGSPRRPSPPSARASSSHWSWARRVRVPPWSAGRRCKQAVVDGDGGGLLLFVDEGRLSAVEYGWITDGTTLVGRFTIGPTIADAGS